MLPATAAALAVLAAALAWPVPALLGRARWPGRDPLVALVCWQAIGLAGGLSIIGALLVHGLAPWGHSLPEAWWSWVRGEPAGGPVRGDHWVAMTLAAVLALQLVGVLALSWFRTARVRRRHRQLLELVVEPGAAPDTRLLPLTSNTSPGRKHCANACRSVGIPICAAGRGRWASTP